MTTDINDAVMLAARLLLTALFLIFGYRKLVDIPGTKAQMVEERAPAPVVATAISVLMELPVSFAVAVGMFTRVFALLMAFYTLGTALIGHRYWALKGRAKIDSMDSFFKNLAIIGGFLLLYLTGAGRYSIDALIGIAAH